MRILFVDRSSAQAIWSLLIPVARRLQARGDHVMFVRWHDGNAVVAECPGDIETVDIPVGKELVPVVGSVRQYLAFFPRFRSILRKFRPDAVHTNFAIPAIAARCIARAEKVPIVVSTQHEMYGSMRPDLRLGLKLTEPLVDTVVSVSKAVAESFGHHDAIDTHAIASRNAGSPHRVVIPNGIATPKIDIPTRDSNKIVCVGRLTPEKRQRDLIEALPVLLQTYPELRVVFVGNGHSEPSLRKAAEALGVSKRVDFLGWRPHTETLTEIATARAFVLASTQEGFGLAVVEAMMCETPAALSRIGPFLEICGGQENLAAFFDARAPIDLASALNRILSDPQSAGQRAARAKAHVIDRYSHETMARAYLSLYDRLLNASPEADIQVVAAGRTKS